MPELWLWIGRLRQRLSSACLQSTTCLFMHSVSLHARTAWVPIPNPYLPPLQGAFAQCFNSWKLIARYLHHILSTTRPIFVKCL